MDREEALGLLKGGEQGIAEWNRRRKAGESIPDFSDADLSGAHLPTVQGIAHEADGPGPQQHQAGRLGHRWYPYRQEAVCVIGSVDAVVPDDLAGVVDAVGE